MIKQGTFKFDERNKANTYKFIASMIPIDGNEIEENNQLLEQNGIILSRPSQMKICAVEKDELVKRINSAKEMGILDKVQKSPLSLLDGRIFTLKKESNNQITDVKEDSAVIEEKKENTLDSILNTEPTKGFDENTFSRYTLLSDMATHVIETVNTKSLTKDGVFNYLERMIIAGVNDDEKVLMIALTYGKNYPDEIINKINLAIQDEFAILNEVNDEKRLAA